MSNHHLGHGFAPPPHHPASPNPAHSNPPHPHPTPPSSHTQTSPSPSPSSPSSSYRPQFPIAQPTPLSPHALSPTWGAPPPIPSRPASTGPSPSSNLPPPENATWPAFPTHHAHPAPPPRAQTSPHRPSVQITGPTPPPSHSQASYPPPLPPRSPRVGQGSNPPYSHPTPQSPQSSSPRESPRLHQNATFASPTQQQGAFPQPPRTPPRQHTVPPQSPQQQQQQHQTSRPRPIPLLPDHSEPHTSPPRTSRPLASPPHHRTSHPLPTPPSPTRHTSSTHASPPRSQSHWPNEKARYVPAPPISSRNDTFAGSSSSAGAGPSRSGQRQSPSPPGPSFSTSPTAASTSTLPTAIATPMRSTATTSSSSPTSPLSPSFTPQAPYSSSGPRVVPLMADYKAAFLGEEAMRQAPLNRPLPQLPAAPVSSGSADQRRSSSASPRPQTVGTRHVERQGRLSQPSLAVPPAAPPQPSSPMPSDPLEGLISDVDELHLEPPPTYNAALSHPAVPPNAVSPAAVSPRTTSHPLPREPPSPPVAASQHSASPTSPDAATLMSTLIPGMGTFAGISTLFNTQPEPPKPFELVIDRPVPIPTVRMDDPADIVFRCPGPDNVRPYALTWYHMRGGHDTFLMCSKCHQDFVADTPYAKEFVELKEHRNGMCSYAAPIAAYKLLPEAKRTRDGTALLAWVKERETKRHCIPGSTLTPADNIEWFAPKGNATNDFVVCAECMDDVVSVTPFADKFEAHDMPADASWHCDGALETMRNNLLRAGSIGPAAWEAFCTNINRMQMLPVCDGKDVESTSRKWYTTSRPIHGFVCCERCYLEFIKASPYASEFVPYDQPPAPGVLWGCDFSSPRMRYAFEVAVDHGSFDIWWTAMDTVVRKMLDRDARPGLDMDMWGLANVPTFASWGEGCNSDFSLCGECYPAFVTPLRLEKFFRPRARGTGHKCSFCDQPSVAIRFPVYLTKMAQALDWGLWTPFYETAFWLGFAPPCPRRELVDPVGRRWWGWRPNLQICEECYWTFARDTWAEPHFDYKGVVTGDSKNICTLYSPLMRAQYLDACKRKDAAELLAFAEKRGHAYVNFYLPMKALLLQIGGGGYGTGTASMGPAGTMGTLSAISSPVNGYSYSPWGTQGATGYPSVAAQILHLEQEWEKFE